VYRGLTTTATAAAHADGCNHRNCAPCGGGGLGEGFGLGLGVDGVSGGGDGVGVPLSKGVCDPSAPVIVPAPALVISLQMPYVQMPRCVLVFSEVVMMAVVSERWPVNVTVKSIQYSLVACLGACRWQHHRVWI
jgi:hypothetical protein